MRLGPPPEVEEEPGQFWKDFIRETAPVFRKPTIEQLSEFIEPTWRALCDGARYVDDRLREIFDEVEPDVIVEDNVVCFPAIHALGPAVGAHRLLQPARGEGRRTSRRSSPATRPATARAGTSSAPSTRARPPICTASSPRSARSAARRALPAGRVHPRVGLARTCTLYPARGRLRARHAARADVASRSTRASGAPTRRPSASGSDRFGRRRARLPLARQPRLGRRRPDEAARRRALARAAPVHRLEGAAGVRVRAGREHVGRGVRPPARAPPARRRRDHARAGTTRRPSASTSASR